MGSVPILRRTLVRAIVLFLGLALALAETSPVSAAQNAPVWGPVNTWTYRSLTNPNVTRTWTVDRLEIVAVDSTNYSTWHVWMNTTTVSSSGSTTFTEHRWLTVDALKLVKGEATYPFLGTVTDTYSPPEPFVVFPLGAGTTWSGTSTVTRTSIFGTQTSTASWSGQFMSEGSVTVPAGTFVAAAARVPSTGAPYAIYYYSDVVGWAVKIENYDNNGVLTDTMQLTSYRYSPPLGGNLLGLPLAVWVIVIVLIAVFVVMGALVLRRRRPPMMPMPPTGGVPPQRPPIEPPPGSPP